MLVIVSFPEREKDDDGLVCHADGLTGIPVVSFGVFY